MCVQNCVDKLVDNNIYPFILERNFSNCFYIFLLDVNFENLILGLHFFYYILYASKILSMKDIKYLKYSPI